MAGVIRSLSPSSELRAFKWLAVTHGLGMLAFFVLMATFFWYLQRIEREDQAQTMYRDIEWAQQTMKLRWRDVQEEMVSRAPEWSGMVEDRSTTAPAMPDFMSRSPDIAYLAMIDSDRTIRWVLANRGAGPISKRLPGTKVEDLPGYSALESTLRDGRSVFTAPFPSDGQDVLVELYTPVFGADSKSGVVVVAFSMEHALNQLLGSDLRNRYQLSIIDPAGNTLIGRTPREARVASLTYELPLDPPGHGIRLRAHAFAIQATLLERTLLVAVAGLTLAGGFSLFALWRHARRRVRAEVERDRLFTLSLDLMAVLDLNGRFIRVNPAFEQTLGIGAKHETLLDLVCPEERERVGAMLRHLEIPRRGSPLAIEFEARFRRGREWRWLHWSVRRDPESDPGGLYAVAHDTTQRKQHESALASEAAFRRAMDDSMFTGMRAIDMHGRITYVNKAFCEMLGLQPEELIGKTAPYPYWPRTDIDEHESMLRHVLAGHEPAQGLRVRVERKDGRLIDVRMFYSPLIDSHGEQTGWMTSMIDITEPTRIREELAAAQERFTTVLNELDSAVSVVSIPVAPTQGGAAPEPSELLFANRYYRRTFGDTIHGHESLIVGRSRRSEWGVTEIFNDDTCRWFEVRLRRIRWVDGSMVQMLVAKDVTRRREAEDQQREQAEKLQRTSRLVTMGEMASSLAHELNQPLTAISNYCMGMSARLRAQLNAGREPDLDELLAMLGKTSGQAERAGRVIGRIRSFVKRREPERKPCEINAIVGEAVELAQIDAERHGVLIRVHLPQELPTLQADPILIEQVLLNLVKNGVESTRASPRREVDVTVQLHGRRFEFAVSDTGTGLAPETREKLFEPFFTTKAEGMGMGLNICRSIIEAHQGQLWVEDNPGGGSTFRFTLPREAEQTGHAEQAAA